MFGDIIGALIGAGANMWSSSQTNKANERSMKHGVQWRVADAKAAGIHPLAALGANMQPVPSQPLLGDAAIAGLSGAAKKAFEEKDQLAEDEQRARIANTQAQTALLNARSRSVSMGARQPAGTVSPVPIRSGDLGTVTRNERYSRAQDAQDEFGDVVENVVGIPSYMESILMNMEGREKMRQRRRYGEILRDRRSMRGDTIARRALRHMRRGPAWYR